MNKMLTIRIIAMAQNEQKENFFTTKRKEYSHFIEIPKEMLRKDVMDKSPLEMPDIRKAVDFEKNVFASF